jgi:crotonobetainyl-CoA:carnitine CoA-transferase CaiB-like acyl-CoA transferase
VAVSARDEGERAGLSRALGMASPDGGGAVDPERVAAFCAQRTCGAVVKAAEEARFSAAPVRGGKDHYHDPHLRARGTVCSVEDPLYGRVDEYGPAPKLSESPGRIRECAKPVGWHNERVFGKVLGLSGAEMEELYRRKVIGKWADAPGARPPKGVSPS